VQIAAIRLSYLDQSLSRLDLLHLHGIADATLDRLVIRFHWPKRKRLPRVFNMKNRKPQISSDARAQNDPPEIFDAKRTLQRAGFVVYGKDPYMVGTHWLDRTAFLAKAERYGRGA
jgi:hypothetical protein